jgi:response regulator RpfG family c-di-GMP phosphodiesterase
MYKAGPVIIIEDDMDDQSFFIEAFKELPYENELLFFDNGAKALNFLENTEISPFIILSDINMPIMHGFELREKLRIDARLKTKCIPYLFFTTASDEQSVRDAYGLSVQGFFVKPNNVLELVDVIRLIVEYWKKCKAPNDF